MQEVVFHAVTPQLEWDNIWMVRHDVENDSLLYAYTWSDIAQALDGGYAPISGNGTVATITFEGIAEGQTTLHFASVRCGDPDGILIPFLSVDGNVAVSQQPVTWVLEMPFGSKTFEVLVLTDCYEVDGSGFSSSLSQVYFNVTSDLDWFCNVTMPKTLLDGAFKVLIDETVVSSTLAWNVTHTFVCFNSTLSHTVTIVGERVLPIPGDLNYDAIVDVLDAIILANHFNEGV